MTNVEISLVQNSFQKVVPIADKAAEIFYAKLFELDPTLKPLFKGNLDDQGKKLMSMIAAAVNGLNNLAAIVPAVQDLGKRHKNYKVPKESYNTVGAALIDTLEVGLGDEFTPDVKHAWVKVYGILSTAMIEASDY
jgi:hemoglobin-like flavoprotein